MSFPSRQHGTMDGVAFNESLSRKATRSPPPDDICCIYVHAGAGYHSHQNERIHLEACNDAAAFAMCILKNGGSATDAVEAAIKLLEDREITNAGYGSNLAMDGVVECDASIVDHFGRSGAVGAVAQIKNPISLARLVYEHTSKPLTLRRVPPNLLCAQGATEFAAELGMPILPHDALISPAAKERWVRWRADLKGAERKARKTDAHPSSYTIKSSIEPAEELAQMRIRQQHTQDLLRNHPSLLQSPSPDPSDESLHSSVMNSTSTLSDPPAYGQPSDQPGENLPVTPERPTVYPTGDISESTVAESSHNAFINSTQKVPTVNQFKRHKAVHIAASDHGSEDSEMEEMPPGPVQSGLRHKTWGDGTDEKRDVDPSECMTKSPHGTPSATPSNITLPKTLIEKATPSPSSRMGTPLSHVKETAPRPPKRSGAPFPQPDKPDHITDTVGAIAVDSWGRIACGASSGGIGMKYRGRVGPAALVGVGAAVVPMDPEDTEQTSVATVTSGTGEHMATTMAATVCAERLYQSVKKTSGGEYAAVTEDEALKAMIENEFMGHPSVMNSNSAGAIGILGLKKMRTGILLYYGHNTDSFALASMSSNEDVPKCSMSRSQGNGQIAQGGRMLPARPRKKSKPTPRAHFIG